MNTIVNRPDLNRMARIMAELRGGESESLADELMAAISDAGPYEPPTDEDQEWLDTISAREERDEWLERYIVHLDRTVGRAIPEQERRGAFLGHDAYEEDR